MQIYGQLQNAALEILSSDPSASVTGRTWYNSTTAKVMVDDGTNKRSLLRNDQNCVFGSSGTAANNIRLQRGASSVLQFVTGDDATAEGSMSTSLAKISAKFESYTLAGKPSPGNAGRVIYITDNTSLYLDTGSAFLPVVFSTGASITGSLMANATVTQTQMANLSIGTAQLIDASVTQAKRASLGQQLSSGVATYSIPSSTTAVTGLSLTITTTGRPVWVGLVANGSGDASISTVSGKAIIKILRDGTEISSQVACPNTNGIAGYVPASSIVHVDAGATAASHTYSISARYDTLSSGSAGIENCKLLAFEL